MGNFTVLEEHLQNRFRKFLTHAPTGGVRANLIEFLVFGLKQAWACIFGAVLLSVIIAAHFWYPDDAVLAKNDFLTLAAVVIQLLMVLTRLETTRELRVIILFHIIGTVMELFKTSAGSWNYQGDGLLRIGAVPLFSGFMYAAVGSYMVRVYRLFDLRFAHYPRRWITAILAGVIYLNFFSHHFIADFRWILLAVVALIYGRCIMHYRVFRRSFKMPLILAFLLVALFIWFAENIGTWSNTWVYPNQLNGWQLVSLDKLASWFLLMIISVVLVAWVYKPEPPHASSMLQLMDEKPRKSGESVH